ncbi:MAG TPA: hypothetical protein P5155_00865 [Candidatus Absconditabacterales bacterium]|nr:hypothetical protein [Candidatus Absconditabacterales bacterium]
MSDNSYHFESQTIRWSVIVLCISLLLVYVVLFYVKGDLRKKNLNTQQSTGDIIIREVENSYSTGLNGGEADEDIMTGNQIITGLLQTELSQSAYTGIINTGINITGINSGDDIENMIILSGTKTYYGELDFVDKMGISYSYALVDQKGIYYLNMGNYNYDFSDIARKLKGNLYVMNTDQELIANSLFGNKVTFINIPEYKNKKVLFLLDINNQSWLLAIDYEIYHQVKPYLKSLFIY